MKAGKAFELFVKHLLINIGFSEVASDGIYVFDGAPGQMLQGLGEAHNADVLLDPPVQTPFYSPTRLLIECKDYQTRIGILLPKDELIRIQACTKAYRLVFFRAARFICADSEKQKRIVLVAI